MKLWGLASWQAYFVMSSSQELNCKTFYDKLNGCPTSRFSGRGLGYLANALGFLAPLILSVGKMRTAFPSPARIQSINDSRGKSSPFTTL
jgi:hypothetical protein